MSELYGKDAVKQARQLHSGRNVGAGSSAFRRVPGKGVLLTQYF